MNRALMFVCLGTALNLSGLVLDTPCYAQAHHSAHHAGHQAAFVRTVYPAFGQYYASTIYAYSANVRAEAEYLRSQGDLLVGASIARQNDSLAAEQEMKNAVQWVHTYFERRELNRKYRAQEDPGYLERQSLRDQKRKQLVTVNYHTAVASELTDHLNWMQRELMANSTFYLYVQNPNNLATSNKADTPLGKDDIHHIRLSDGVGVSKAFVFRADSANALSGSWPRLLLAPQFDSARAGFEKARDAALVELTKDAKLSRATESRMMAAVDNLCDLFNANYRVDEQLGSQREFSVYLSGKRFLQSLALATYRLIDTQDARALNGSLKFEGESTIALLRHTITRGLEFAPPEAGDEGTYRKLFFAVRNIYLQFATDDTPLPQPVPKQQLEGARPAPRAN